MSMDQRTIAHGTTGLSCVRHQVSNLINLVQKVLLMNFPATGLLNSMNTLECVRISSGMFIMEKVRESNR
jgi:hypothetical protein